MIILIDATPTALTCVFIIFLYDFYINYIKLAFFLRIFTYSLEREEDQYKRNLSEIFTVYKLLIRRLGGGGSTNSPSDLYQILTYDIFDYTLTFSKEKNLDILITFLFLYIKLFFVR